MFDVDLVRQILTQINDAITKIRKRFEPVTSVDDFTSSDAGMEKLDSICMLLIAIGEGVKQIDSITDRNLLPKYPEIDWKGVKGLRDIISHHYFDIDAEQIYYICRYQLKPLTYTIQKMINDLNHI